MVIQHNIAAINSHRNLGINNSATSKNLEKLSSGYRINRAGDDAAGLAISEKMRGQIRGLAMAEQNASNGISLIQTAEGGLNETHAILQRMRELAVQASNGTYQDEDRLQITHEITALKEEIDRISTSTHYNGIQLLNGNLSDKIRGDITADAHNILSSVSLDAGETKGTTYAVGNFTITPGAAPVPGSAADATYDLSAINAATSAGNLTITLGGSHTITVTLAGTETVTQVQEAIRDAINSDGKYSASLSGDDLTIEEKAVNGKFSGNAISFTFADTDTTGVGAFSTAPTASTPGTKTEDGSETVEIDIGTTTYELGVHGTLSGDNWTITDASGNEFVINLAAARAADAAGATPTATVEAIEGEALIFQIGANGSADQQVELEVNDMGSRAIGTRNAAGVVTASIQNIDLRTRAGANAAIQVIDDATNQVSSQRAQLGALQNRLEHTLNNLGITKENLTAAESTIRDVDMAKEMMEFTKNSILVQASQAMLAQANQLPQGVLSLLR